MKKPNLKVTVGIKPSKILPGEVGLFALENFKRDSIVLPASQFDKLTLIPWTDFDSLSAAAKERVLGFCPGTKKGFYTPPDLNFLTIAWFVNHSCEPNLGFDTDFNFVAMKSIKSGNELLWDYSFDETNPNFKMVCMCSSKKCRKIINGNDWIQLAKKKPVQKYLSPHVKKLISK